MSDMAMFQQSKIGRLPLCDSQELCRSRSEILKPGIVNYVFGLQRSRSAVRIGFDGLIQMRGRRSLKVRQLRINQKLLENQIIQERAKQLIR